MEKMQKAVAVVDDLWWNRHGFPQGYHFVPSDLELIRLLEDIIAGRALPRPLPSIFRNVRIREYHPAELYEKYKAHKEAGCIYFFSQREFPGNARVRPRRFAKDGWWKASGGGEPLQRGGLTVGSKLTLVFYDKKPRQKVGVKTDWAIKEYTKIAGKKKAEEMALYRYRLYKMNKPANAKQATQEDEGTPASTWAKEEEEDEEEAPPSPPHPPAGGTSSQAQAGQPHDYHYYACDAAPGPSTSRSVTLDAATYLSQHNGVQYTHGLGHWDALPAMVPSGPAAVAYDLPVSAQHFAYQETALDARHFGYQETTYPLKTQLLPASADHFAYQETAVDANHFGCQETPDRLKTQLPPPPPAPAAQGSYLADEFDDWCETQQGSQQVPVSPSFPMPDDMNSQQVALSPPFPMPDDMDSQQVAASPLPMLKDVDFDGLLEDIDIDGLLEDMQMMPTEENSERLSCTLDELLYPKMEDDAPSPSPPPADGDAQRSRSE